MPIAIITFGCMNLQDQSYQGPWPLWQEEKKIHILKLRKTKQLH